MIWKEAISVQRRATGKTIEPNWAGKTLNPIYADTSLKLYSFDNVMFQLIQTLKQLYS